MFGTHKKDAASTETTTKSTKTAKKPIYKKPWFWVVILILAAVGSIGGGDNAPETTQPETTPPAVEETVEPEQPTLELENDSERSVWNAVTAQDGELVTITSEDTETGFDVTAEIKCTNDEEVVNAIAAPIAEALKASEENERAWLAFSDVKDGTFLTTILVYADGTIETQGTTIAYNNAYNNWVNDQFSAWDGSHKELEQLVIQNLNDEKSYEHIETVYRRVNNEDTRDEINAILEEAGYDARVEVDDLFIQLQFSAANAFGGTIKNTAIGIASYSANTITLVDIG